MFGFVRKYIKKIRNLFHIPGEDVILLGFDDRNKSVRIYDLYIKTGSKFESKLESKVVEGNVAVAYLWYARRKIEHLFSGHYDKDNPDLLHVEFTIDKREGCIFKTEDKPEGIVYPVDMQTGQGVQLVKKSKSVVMKSDGDNKFISDVKDIETKEVADASYQVVTVPQQIKLIRDPILEVLVSINPYFWGSTIDSFIATELLRGRVEIWKTILIASGVGVLCLIIGMGMK